MKASTAFTPARLRSTIGDGYTATVVVNRPPGACEVYRDEVLARGHRWARPDEALAYAIGKGREFVRTVTRAGG